MLVWMAWLLPGMGNAQATTGDLSPGRCAIWVRPSDGPSRKGSTSDRGRQSRSVYHNVLIAVASRAQGFAEGIEAALKWHQAEYRRLIARAETALRHERFVDCADMLNQAIEHARSLPAIRALAQAPPETSRE